MRLTVAAFLLSMFHALFALPASALDVAKYVVAEEITGVVVDAETGKPIAGAVVAIRFERNNTGHAGPHCFRSMAVETDAEGKFRFAPWKQQDTRANVTYGEIAVYKQGYARLPKPIYVRQARRSIAGIAFSDTITIPKTELRVDVPSFEGSDEERMRELSVLASRFTCRWQAEFDDLVLLARIREEAAASPFANQKPEPGRINFMQRIDRLMQGAGPKR